MDRAWSTFELKSVKQAADGKRTFTGIASTINTDRMDDIVLPKGAKFKTPFPFLWQHDSKQPIGWVRTVRAGAKQIEVDVEIHNTEKAGTLKNRLDEAWDSIEAKLVQGLSIGFNPIKVARIEGTYGYEIQEWDWMELSAVTIPANADCSITSIKSIDKAQLAATGQRQGESGRRDMPGASGTKTASGGDSTTRSPKGKTEMKTIAELRQERNTKADRLTELVELRKSESRKFNDEERTEFDTLSTEIEDLDDEIRVKNFHTTNASSATGVDGKSAEGASRSRGGLSFVRKADPEPKFKGQEVVRSIIAKAVAVLNQSTASAIAEHRWGKTHPQLVAWIKANEVAGGGTGSGEWGAELVSFDGRSNADFQEFLYGATAFDKLPFREVPANVTIKGQDGEATGYWVGESKAIPATKPDFSTVNLSPLKVGALSVVSNDLLRYSAPSAEGLVAEALRQASAKRIDQTVFSAAAASAGVSPAGLLNGLSAIPTTGTDDAAVRAMVSALYAPFIAALNSSGLYWVMGAAQAKAISMLVNALGQSSFPTVTGQGGSLMGDPIVVGDNIDASQVILIKPSDIYKIGDTGFELSISKDATIEQSTVPTGATDTPTAMTVAAPATNMFQEDSTAIKIVRHINFAKRRTSAVAYTDTADFQGVAS